jgi:hypothetical protein
VRERFGLAEVDVELVVREHRPPVELDARHRAAGELHHSAVAELELRLLAAP